MDAMILAAGEGTRLRAFTDRIPKALVPVRGRPLLAHVMERLVAAGATRPGVNTSRHGERIQEFLAAHAPPGVEIALSPEPDGPYDTGGGVLAAAPLLRGRGAFFLHAVDVLSRIPLEQLVERHREARAAAGDKLIATLAVQDRGSRRRLLFDAQGLVGWEQRGEDGVVVGLLGGRDPVGPVAHWSFSGVHVVEPALLDLPHPPGRFTMVNWYLDLARSGYRIGAADVSGHPWLDVGTPERLREAEAGDW